MYKDEVGAAKASIADHAANAAKYEKEAKSEEA
jgi:hypothetical protein